MDDDDAIGAAETSGAEREDGDANVDHDDILPRLEAGANMLTEDSIQRAGLTQELDATGARLADEDDFPGPDESSSIPDDTPSIQVCARLFLMARLC